MLTLTPVVCMLAAIGFSTTLDKYLTDEEPMPETSAETKKKKKEPSNKKEVLKVIYTLFLLIGFDGAKNWKIQ